MPINGQTTEEWDKLPFSELYQFINKTQEDYSSLSRFYRIPNSPERGQRLKDFLLESKAELLQFPYEDLSVNGQVDYQLIKRYLDDKIHSFTRNLQEYEELSEWFQYDDAIYQLEKLRRRGKQLNGMEIAAQLEKTTKQIIENNNKLSNSEPNFKQSLTKRAKRIIRGHQLALKSVFEFYEGYDPEFTWWVEKPMIKIDSALEAYSQNFDNCIDESLLPPDDGSGIIGSPIGRAELLRQLEFELIPYSPEKLIEIATKEFEFCDKEMLKASAEMGFGKDWRNALEKVKQSHVEPGQQPEEMLKLYNESVDFLKSKDLISIPPLAEETWRMSMISPERQLVSPFFLGGEILQIAYPTDEMDHEHKMMSMRGNNPHFCRAVVHHELIAGHHLQRFMNNRNKDYRPGWTPFWTEGWALYWELLLYEMEFPQSAEDRVGMLFWRKHRCARIIFSINYHLGKWTPQECIDYLVDRVGHERANAEGEIRRSFTGDYGPLYQIAYMIGGLQFYELKKELVDSGEMTYKEYHDAVLKENNLPVELLRAILLKQKLSKDFKTNWKFYER